MDGQVTLYPMNGVINFWDVMAVFDRLLGENIRSKNAQKYTVITPAGTKTFSRKCSQLRDAIESSGPSVASIYLIADDMVVFEAVGAKDGGRGGGHTPTIIGRHCSECGNNSVIKRDGCSFCTSCGAVGSCG